MHSLALWDWPSLLTNCLFFQALERLLPKRPPFEMPTGDHVEEADLHDYDPDSSRGASGSRTEAYDSEDEERYRGPGVQCAHQ